MIEKGKILQIWDKGHNNVIKYTQILKDVDTDKKIVVEGESLNDLMSKVKNTLLNNLI